MSASCVGTCSNCGIQRFWLSDTLSLQMDDGRLVCLPHPGERWNCEDNGLTLGQASERRRLFRETFYVCRNCGRGGETIKGVFRTDTSPTSFAGGRSWVLWWIFPSLTVTGLSIWAKWWNLAIFGGSMLLAPLAVVWKERSDPLSKPARGLPRPDAPGQFPIPEPTVGLHPDNIIGREIGTDPNRWPQATGPCCDNPEWLPASSIRDDNRVPCHACGAGVMVVSDHSLH